MTSGFSCHFLMGQVCGKKLNMEACYRKPNILFHGWLNFEKYQKSPKPKGYS